MFGNFGRGKREPQMDLDAMFAQIEQGLESAAEKRGRKQPKQDPALLTSACAALLERHTFAPGDLVTWKPLMQDRKTPNYGEPVIVVAVLDEPVYGTNEKSIETGSPHFRTPLDIVCGRIFHFKDDGSDPTFELFHYDSRRLMPWVAPE